LDIRCISHPQTRQTDASLGLVRLLVAVSSPVSELRTVRTPCDSTVQRPNTHKCNTLQSHPSTNYGRTVTQDASHRHCIWSSLGSIPDWTTLKIWRQNKMALRTVGFALVCTFPRILCARLFMYDDAIPSAQLTASL
jgi:hypothetical protein